MVKKRLNIGFFTCHLDNDYAYDICKGVDYACKELDANLIIFPGMYINSTYNYAQKAHYDYQYNSIFYYASKKNLDALIVSIGTIGSFLAEKDLQSFLNNFKDIPLITIEVPVQGYNHLYIESNTGLEKAIEHLILEHNKKCIGFVGGRQSNADSIDRFNTYKNTLAKHNLPIEDNLIVHGDYSEFCEDLVEQLLDNNPDMDAIVFANDQMALGGYNVFNRRGIVIGRDICVVGYDDAPIALALDPPLTTVKANPSDMGYYAVHEVVTLAQTGSTTRSILNSDLIIRESCGCGSRNDYIVKYLNSLKVSAENSDEIIDNIINTLLNDLANTYIREELNNSIRDIFSIILKIALDESINDFPIDSINDSINKLLNSSIVMHYNINRLIYLFNAFNKIVIPLIHSSTKQISYSITINAIFSKLSANIASARYSERRDYNINTWTTSYIIRDALAYGRDDNECFNAIMTNLRQLPFESSYLYLYDTPALQMKDGSWNLPKALTLKAYNKDNTTKVLKSDNATVSSYKIFNNRYVNSKERSTIVLTPLFTNEQNHGIFVCNVDIKYFYHICSTSLQLGAALRFLHLLKEQTSTQDKLLLSLQEIHDKNLQLNHISESDELTGLYNRRGFLEKAQYFIKSHTHVGKRAIIIFADMDNLKLVNDKFGHKDGDFALKSIAQILKNSFRNEDIIGRLGGDEFVAFAIVDEDNLSTKIQTNIEYHSKLLNDTCEKPYYIDMSIGISEFVCGNDANLEDILSEADAVLYSNKKYKRKSVLKNI